MWEKRDCFPLEWVEDDGGRAEAGYKGIENDCVVRALAILTHPYSGRAKGRHYRECYKLMVEAARKRYPALMSARRGFKYFAFSKVFKNAGLKLVWERKICTMNIATVYKHYGDCIVATCSSKHLAAIIDGCVHDMLEPCNGLEKKLSKVEAVWAFA